MEEDDELTSRKLEDILLMARCCLLASGRRVGIKLTRSAGVWNVGGKQSEGDQDGGHKGRLGEMRNGNRLPPVEMSCGLTQRGLVFWFLSASLQMMSLFDVLLGVSK